MSLAAASLRTALSDRATYRLMALAALDQLADAQRTIAKQKEQIQEMRDERERYARRVFDV